MCSAADVGPLLPAFPQRDASLKDNREALTKLFVVFLFPFCFYFSWLCEARLVSQTVYRSLPVAALFSTVALVPSISM